MQSLSPRGSIPSVMAAGDEFRRPLVEEPPRGSLAGQPMGNGDETPRRGRFSLVTAWGPWLVLVAGAAWAIWSWQNGGVVFELLRTDLDAAAQIERLRAAF